MNRAQRRADEARHSSRVGAIPSAETELLWSVVRQAFNQDRAGHRGGLRAIAPAVGRARRAVLTPSVMNLAEALRIEDLGVTIHSFEKCAVWPGVAWLEWDANLEARGEPLPGQVCCDRTGVLTESDSSGLRGSMTIVTRVASSDDQYGGMVCVCPLAVDFDLREDFEPPPSLLRSASVAEARVHFASVDDPTLGESEASAVTVSAMSRRFGFRDSPFAADMVGMHPESERRAWHEADPALLATVAHEAMFEVLLLLCALLVMRTSPMVLVEVLKGAKLGKAGCGLAAAPLSYSILSLAQPVSRRADR